jgi:hypothetical protein
MSALYGSSSGSVMGVSVTKEVLSGEDLRGEVLENVLIGGRLLILGPGCYVLLGMIFFKTYQHNLRKSRNISITPTKIINPCIPMRAYII